MNSIAKLLDRIPASLFVFFFPFLAYWQAGLFFYTLKWDNLEQFFPYRYFISESLREGVLPAWNPFLQLGWPFHADPQSAFWYPVTWLLAVVRGYDVYTMNFDFIFHIAIAGVGFFVLLKGMNIRTPVALLFSIAYQCCGVFVNNAQHLTWLIALAWLPFVVHHYFRLSETLKLYHAVAAGFFMMLMLTGGYPIFMVILNYFLVVVFLIYFFRLIKSKNYRNLFRYIFLQGAMFGVFAVLASGYLISFFEVFPHCSRADGLSLAKALEGPFPPRALISLLFPFSVARDDHSFLSDLSMLNVYLGLIPLFSAVISFLFLKDWKIRLFLLFGIVCLLVAFGEHTPVRAFLFHYVPMMDTFRFPSIFRAFFIFGFLVAGALALNKIQEAGDSLKKYFLPIVLFVALIVTTFHFYYLPRADYFVKFPALFDINAYRKFFDKSTFEQRIAIQSLVQLSFLLLLAALFFRIKKVQTLLWGLLLFTSVELLLNTQFSVPATAFSEVRTKTYHQRFSEMPKGFPLPVLQPIHTVPAYDERLYPSWYNHNIFMKQIGYHGSNSFYLTSFMDFYDSPESASTFQKPLFFIEGDDSYQIKPTFFNPNTFHVSVSTNQDARLTLLQSRYEGWQAFVNDEEVPLIETAIPFLTINLPSGKNEVRFQYNAVHVKPALIFSFTLFFLVSIFLIFSWFAPGFFMKRGIE